ncbi:hypothetical protein AYO49_00510 [Verrucomicrobiaceae bacterium SCGC AG-212-N21]|nr:hypothetical protein AYO49_00510 [Verrucomicrobiaceae bacterium SCGC AG-212-N21]
MKIQHHVILILTALTLSGCTPVRAGWFNSGDEQRRLVETENQLLSQRASTDGWQIIAGLFGMGCVLLFVFGTALGTRTRTRHAPRP